MKNTSSSTSHDILVLSPVVHLRLETASVKWRKSYNALVALDLSSYNISDHTVCMFLCECSCVCERAHIFDSACLVRLFVWVWLSAHVCVSACVALVPGQMLHCVSVLQPQFDRLPLPSGNENCLRSSKLQTGLFWSYLILHCFFRKICILQKFEQKSQSR